MRIVQLLILAGKYLKRYLRRYIFLLSALTFGFAVITVITSLQDGMYRAVYDAAQGHYAGDVLVVGFDNEAETRFRITQTDEVLEGVRDAGLSPNRIVKRTQFGQEGVVYFHGTAVRHKYVIGVDWQNEREYFSGLDYVAGGPPQLSETTEDIFLSKPVAEELQARVGDEVTLEVHTRTGQKNTGSFIVRGIVDNSSIFGYYKSYVSRTALNRLLRYEENACSTIGLYFPGRGGLEQKTKALQETLEGRINMGPLMKSRDDINSTWATGKGIRHYVLTLDVYLSEVADLLNALNLVGYFLYAMMLLIVLASIFVTYKLILHERAREIGTMRSLGFQTRDVVFVLVSETLMLFAAAIILGLLLARAAAWGISFIDFTWIPSFEIFMKEGRLSAQFLWGTIVANIAILVLVLIPSVWIPAGRMASGELPELLTGGNQ